ncbi:unnamed protein product [Sphenostylis stenocarpa]|uniref:Uncharacterized protein n=1 Tax=Sphenostylis stenocarpa TaxID=92480 RepID=A0AA86S4L0_9FABA|nr:unnamed protein product [Sphenostylis stenocarpa]
MSRVEGGKRSGEEENDLLLKDVETRGKALSRDKTSSTNSKSSKSQLLDPKSKPKAKDNLRKDKKSIWNWKPLKALSLCRSKKFKCSFSVQVHVIEGLPLSFNDSCLCVYWKLKDEHLVTPPAKVIQGVVEFQEILTHTCLINGRRSGPQNSAKYEAKHFLLYASTPGAQLDLGKHRVDLTRLLPLTLEELQEEKRSGIWTTSFRLSGTARGAVMNVSFGYINVGDNTSSTRDNNSDPLNILTPKEYCMPSMDPLKPSQVDRRIRYTGSLPNFPSNYYSSQNVDEMKDLHEVLPSSKSARASSVYIFYKDFVEEKGCSPLRDKPESEGIKENIDPIKPVVCSSSDNEKEKAEENPVNVEKTCSLLHDKPEFDVFQENLETVTLNEYPLPDSGIENFKECEGNEFHVVDKGIEFSSDEQVELEESIGKAFVDVYTVDSTRTLDSAGMQVSIEDHDKQDSLDELSKNSKESVAVREFSNGKDDLWTKELLLQELESALNSVSEFETAAMDSPKIMEVKSEYKLRKSQSLDDCTESIASEFLSMLGIDHSPRGLSFEGELESPRELLLRQFENEVRSEGFSLFDFDTDSDNEADGVYDSSFESKHLKFSRGIKPASSMPDLRREHLIEFEDLRSKQKVQMLEDLETEALMREWGLNENAFQHSPTKDYNGFGSPVYFLPEETTLPLPPLAEGFGPFLQTQDGGFLRSMNPSLFRNSRTGGTLIMQVSNPVVVPAEMGSGIMEILKYFASGGIEKLSKQANKLMPLEDITGKTMQQISREAKAVLKGTNRQFQLQHDLVTGQDSTCAQKGLKGTLSGRLMSNKFSSDSIGNHGGSEFVSLDDLAPLATDKIQALLLEGLRIQSGMSNEDAPSNIIVQSYGDISTLQGKGVSIRGSLGLDGTAAMQVLDTKNSNSDEYDGVDGIMGLSLTLDEWMRLDSGEIDDDIDNISEHTSKLLAAHHANSFDLIRGKSSKGEMKRGRKCGLLGNKFTVALMDQLRDPLRNNEPVGTPMLALIQVERMFIPPKQQICRHLYEAGNNNDECEMVPKVEMKANEEEKSYEEEAIPQFKITEVHVAGLKIDPRKKKFWGTSRRQQQQSGSRWLIANGMGKSSKNPPLKSTVVSKSSSPITTTNVQEGDTLWSISSRIGGTPTRWKEFVELNPHIRNPNIINTE